LSDFWAELEEAGTPLVEPAEDAGSLLVTLVLRVGADEERFVARLGLAGLDPRDRRLRRLEGTDVAYRTYVAPRDLRTIYAFAATDDADTDALLQDPLSKRPYVYPADDEDPNDHELRVSLVELPDAPKPAWSLPTGAPAGTTEVHRLQSTHLDGERRVYVYMPPGYGDDGGPYPLLILFDGWAFTRMVSAPTTLDNLIHAGIIPPLIAIMPDSPDSPARRRDLWLYPPFNAFLADEVLPWAKHRWPLTSDASLVVAAGSSLGGLAATYLALERPDLAGCVLSMSGAFQFSPENDPEPVWMGRELARQPRRPIRFWLDAGALERIAGPADVSLRAANRHVRDVLVAKGYQVAYREYPGGHDYFWWIESLAEGLIALLGDRARGSSHGS
jgi:enterochelin esterase family protein